MYQDYKNFVAFSALLKSDLPNSVFNSEFIKFLLDENWTLLQQHVVRWYFYPYIAYASFSVIYMKLALVKESEEEEGGVKLGMVLLGLGTFMTWLWQMYIEVSQMREEGMRYFCSP